MTRTERLEARLCLAVTVLSISDANLIEPVSGTATLDFTVSRSGELQSQVNISYVTADYTAQAPDDYLSQSGSIRLLPGETSGTISVTVNSDSVTEFVESFSVKLTTVDVVGAVPRFAAPQTKSGGSVTSELRSTNSGDLNGDGKADWIFTGNGEVGVRLNTSLPGTSGPTFGSLQTLVTTGTVEASALADLNGDGQLDIIAASAVDSTSGMISVFLNSTTPGATTATFRPGVTFAAGSQTRAVAVGDFNGDGLPDVAAANQGSHTVSVWLNSTTPGSLVPAFTTRRDVTTGSGPASVVVGDFNRDGQLDLATANSGNPTVSVLLSNTTPGASIPSFQTKTDFTAGPTARQAIAVGDMNGDGLPDLVTIGSASATASVLFNRSTAGGGSVVFETHQDFTLSHIPSSVSVSDVNLDGRLDVVTPLDSTTAQVAVLRNDTPIGAHTGSFPREVDLVVDTSGGRATATVADFNLDGKPDLGVGQVSGQNPAVLLNDLAVAAAAVPQFSPTLLPTGQFPQGVALADFNVDGKLDIVSANRDSNNNTVLINTTPPGSLTPTFTGVTEFTTGNHTCFVSTGDLNGDGRPDFAVASRFTATVSVFLNTMSPGSLTPSFAPKLDLITGSPGNPHACMFVDLNGDGKLDLVAANENFGSALTLPVFFNTTPTGSTTASFSARQDFPIARGPREVTFADINGDGLQDLITSGWGSSLMSVLINTTSPGATTATFLPHEDFPLGGAPYGITPADLNSDGRPDLVIASRGNSQAQVYLNTTPLGASVPTFAPRQDFAVGNASRFVTAADFNGDGRLDLATANFGIAQTTILLNSTAPGSQTVQFTRQDVASGVSLGLVSGDLNGDGKIDIVLTDVPNNGVVVLMNSEVSITKGIGGGSIEEDLGNVPPQIISATLCATRGTITTVRTSDLLVTDYDNTAGELVFTVTSLPTFGQLRLDGVPLTIGSTFTQQNIDEGLVTYRHSGAGNRVDGFNFTVSDSGIPQVLSRVSLSSTAAQGTDDSLRPAISADGRFVAFESFAANLAAGDAGGFSQIYVRDLVNGTTRRASVDNAGNAGTGHADHASLSADGNIVVFRSEASNLVPGDTNGRGDIFLRDLRAGTTTRISQGMAGQQSNHDSSDPRISPDGRFVVFESVASNLVAGDTNSREDVFVYDVQAGVTRLISRNTAGQLGNGNSQSSAAGPTISQDGRWIAFMSDDSTLVADDTNGRRDIFVHDTQTAETIRVSVGQGNGQSNGASTENSISLSGRFVVFGSDGNNLVANDTNAMTDIFLRDTQTGTTTRLSVSSAGTQATGPSRAPADHIALSATGQFVAFTSSASNLVQDDTNLNRDVFLRDTLNNITTRISVNAQGVQGGAHSQEPDISANGRFIVFESDASHLVPDDTNLARDIFVYDRGIVQGRLNISINNPPTITPVANRTIQEDTGTGPISFRVGDIETAAGALTVAVSSGNPALLPTLTVTGTAPNFAVTAVPAPDQSGTGFISITVTDGCEATTTVSFLVTVLPVNDSPTIAAIPDQITDEDTPLTLTFTVGDRDSPVSSLVISGVSSQPDVLDGSGFRVSGTGEERVVVLTPLPDRHGTSLVTLTATDPSGGTFHQTFVLTVRPVDDPLRISGVSDLTIDEDQTGSLNFTLIDDFVPLSTIFVSGSAANSGLVQNLAVTNNQGTGTVTITPAADQVGTTLVTLVANDGLTRFTTTFLLTVLPVNDPPAISPLATVTMLEDQFSGPINLTLNDVDSPVGGLTVSVSSSNTLLVPNNFLSLTGSGAEWSLSFTPVDNMSGTSTLTMTVSDSQGGVTTQSFEVQVLPVNDRPLYFPGADQVARADLGAVTVPGWARSILAGPLESSQRLEFVMVRNTNPALFVSTPVIDAVTGDLTFIPQGDRYGIAVLDVQLRDNGGTEHAGIDASPLHPLTITLTVPAVRRFEFNASPVLQTPGYTSVRGTDVYDEIAGRARTFGWKTAATELDRPSLAASTLLRDGHYGRDNTFVADVPNGTYRVSLMVGDKHFARDRLHVSAQGVAVPELTNISTAAGQFVHRSFETTVTQQRMEIRLKDLGGDPFWVLHALEIRPSSDVSHSLTLARVNPAGTEPLPGDGASLDHFQGTRATPQALVTITTSSGFVLSSLDQDPSFAGVQVRADSQGDFFFSVRRPSTSGHLTATVSAEEVTGARSESLAQFYTAPAALLFDMNTAFSPTRSGYIGVTNTTLFNPVTGYGWQRAVGGADRGSFSSLDESLRDIAYGTDGTFRIVVTPGEVYSVTLRFRDTFAHDKINVFIEGSATPVSSGLTNLSILANTTVEQTFSAASNDGILDLRFRDLSTTGDRNWIVNTIELRRGLLPSLAATDAVFSNFRTAILK